MAVSFNQLHPAFTAEAGGIDCRRPLTYDGVAEVEAGMDQYAVVMFRDQNLTDDNRTTMHRARRFGRNEVRDVRRATLAGDDITIEQHA